MPIQTAIIAALPREIAGLVRDAAPNTTLLREGVSLYMLSNAVVVAAGMGATRAALALAAALQAAPVTMLVSVGLAGACSPTLKAGDVAEASVVIEAHTGERFSTARAHGPVLVSSESIASVQEKARLAAAYNAALVDMEAATVARLAVAHGLGFRAIKAVSDAHDFELASLGRFTGKHGSFRVAAFALHTALRPQTWGKAVELGRNSGRALAALTARLTEMLADDLS